MDLDLPTVIRIRTSLHPGLEMSRRISTILRAVPDPCSNDRVIEVLAKAIEAVAMEFGVPDTDPVSRPTDLRLPLRHYEEMDQAITADQEAEA